MAGIGPLAGQESPPGWGTVVSQSAGLAMYVTAGLMTAGVFGAVLAIAAARGEKARQGALIVIAVAVVIIAGLVAGGLELTS